MKVYLAGKMRQVEEFNFPAFMDAARRLRALGYMVFNPAERDIDNGFDPTGMTGNEDLNDGTHRFSLRDALGADVSWIAAEAEAIVVLPDWERSSGVKAEFALARALSIPVVELADVLWWHAKQDAESAYLMTTDDMERHDVDAVARTTRSLHWVSAIAADAAARLAAPVAPGEEVRSVSATGGEKGVKLARFDLIPPEALRAVAEHFGRGSAKYADHNWRRGYLWSNSFAAMMRHAWAFWDGEDIDEETGGRHVAAVAWHALVLYTFMDEQQGYDDRFAGS